MNWFMKMLFPGTQQTIRISPDHLPGLIPPKPAPFTPKPSKPTQSEGPDIDAMYKRFKSFGGYKPKKRNKNDRGVGF